MFDVIIIGAGVIGSNIARELSSYKLNTLLLEKNSDVGEEISNANSAIIHSGYDPVPNTNKAIFNQIGNPMFDELCKNLDVPFFRIGSLTVAINEDELKFLSVLKKRSEENKVEVRLIDKDELYKLEPNISKNALGALLAPSAGIIDPFLFVTKNVENAIDNGVILKLNEEVIDVVDKKEYLIVKTSKNIYETKCVINAAGFGSFPIAEKLEKLPYTILPRKGEYFVLDHFSYDFVHHIIFPCPSEKGKGILVTPTYSGNILVGPSSEFVSSFGVSTDNETLNNVKKSAMKLVPNIPFNETIRVFSGVRPMPSDHDFHIEPLKNHPRFINLCGIESPGFASSPAIAKYVVTKLVNNILTLEKNINYNPKNRIHYVTYKMTPKDRMDLVNKNPKYGHIICQCERISEGEILDVLSRSDKPKTIKGVKRRCRTGFGKCQGGFCQPLVAKIIANYYHIKLEEVTYSNLDNKVAKYIAKGNNINE